MANFIDGRKPSDSVEENSNKDTSAIQQDGQGETPAQTVQEERKPCKTMAEMSPVENIRKFFDSKAEYLTRDKLSQAYIVTKFKEDELWEYVEKECGTANRDDYQLSVDELRVMFHAYCQDPKFSPTLKFPKEFWKIYTSEKLGELYSWWRQTPKSVCLLYVWRNFLNFSFIGTALVFVWNTPSREQQKYFQAWQVINTAQNQSGTGGRNEAFKYLNGGETLPFLNWAVPQCKKNNTCLVGIKMTGLKEGTNLNDVNLENANLESSGLENTSFRRANLKNAKLKQVNLRGAVFENADLTGADFTNADLTGVNFKGAILTNANFAKAKGLSKSSRDGMVFCNTQMPDGMESGSCKNQ
jgi:uncharacterized protein YjbI with pentapeptide repeats